MNMFSDNPFFRQLYKYKKYILTSLLFILSLSLRAYGMENKYPFGWDQVNNAWAAKNIIINHEFPLVGMVVKQNTGFFIGPVYYYFVAIFYWVTNLNPVASEYVALTTSILTFFVIFFVAKRLFNYRIALIASFINSISFAAFSFDVVQWPVAFLPALSLLIFYFLYRLIRGEEKYLVLLSLATGLAFHIHFTAIFFPIIILLCLPFFPRNKKMLLYLLLFIPLFSIWFIPNLIYQFQNSSQLSNLSGYLNDNYHGFHLKRFIQLTGDGLIQFDPYLYFNAIKSFKALIIPFFIFIFLRKKFSKERWVFSYMTLIFFLVPWLVFSTYKGEISDYYFCINRYVALLILSYLLSMALFARKWMVKIVVFGFLIYYSYLNVSTILYYNSENGLSEKIKKVSMDMVSGKKVGFQEGVPESYIYYYLMRKKGFSVY